MTIYIGMRRVNSGKGLKWEKRLHTNEGRFGLLESDEVSIFQLDCSKNSALMIDDIPNYEVYAVRLTFIKVHKAIIG